MLFDQKSISTFLKNNLKYLDIGARGGLPPEWRSLESILDIHFVDAASDATGDNVLIGKKTTDTVKFYHTNWPLSSGMIKTRKDFISRIVEPHQHNLKVIDTEMMKSISLDDYLEQKSFPEINFLKIDTEGNEHHILEGAKGLLNTKTLLGIKSEVWLGPIKDATAFSRIDTLLRSHHFHLFDFEFRRYTRNSLPSGAISEENPYKCTSDRFGQFLTGDVIYIKDPICSLNENLEIFEWNDTNVVKLAMIYYIYNCPDCALELIIFYKDNYTSELDLNQLKNIFTPLLPSGKKLTYNNYCKLSKENGEDLNFFRKLWKVKNF